MDCKTPNLNRRALLASLAGSAAALVAGPAFARPSRAGPWPRRVAAPMRRPGVIVVSLSRRMLYLTDSDGSALAWPVAVGRAGMAWKGETRIASKHVRPAWQAPASIRGGRGPGPVIPGGAPNNPMGERALVLEMEEIAIHGTSPSMRNSIGGAASAGCIRMLNEHVIDLFERVRVGMPVIAIA